MNTEGKPTEAKPASAWTPQAIQALLLAFTPVVFIGIVQVIQTTQIKQSVAVVEKDVKEGRNKDRARDVVIGDTHKLVNSRFTAALRSLVFLLKNESDRTRTPEALSAYTAAVKDLAEAEAGALAVAESKAIGELIEP